MMNSDYKHVDNVVKADGTINQVPLPKKKRKRTVIPPEDIKKLEATFASEQWPSRCKKEQLAAELGKTEHFVSIWFQNRRARARREGSHCQNGRVVKTPMKNDSGNKVTSMSVGRLDAELKVGNANAVNALKRKINLSPRGKMESHVPNVDIHFDNNDKKVMKIMVKPRDDDSSGKMKEIIYRGKPAAAIPTTVVDTEDTHEPPAKIVRLSGPPGHNLGFVASRTPTSGGVVVMHNGIPLIDGEGVIKKVRTELDEYHRALLHLIGEARRPDNDYSVVVPCIAYRRPVTLFESIVNMVAVIEGGIVSLDDPDFPAAANDAIHGIAINGNCRVIYDKERGLQFIDKPVR